MLPLFRHLASDGDHARDLSIDFQRREAVLQHLVPVAGKIAAYYPTEFVADTVDQLLVWVSLVLAPDFGRSRLDSPSSSSLEVP